MKIARFQNPLTGIFFALIFLITASVSFAGPDRTTYQAKIIKPDGNPLEASGVNFKFTIMDAAATCVLYSETYSGVNMNSTGGLISFSLGSGVKTYPVSGTTFAQVFSNITPNLACDAAGTPTVYTPTATDGRKIVMQFNDGNGWQTLPAMSINAVPYAMYADNSTKFSGMVPSDFVQVSTIPTCLASEALRYTGASFNCVAVGGGSASVTSGSVITALGYTPADGASVTTLISNVTNVSSTVFSVSSTVSTLATNVAASFSAITSSQWATSGTDVYYTSGNVGIGTSTPTSMLSLEASGTANLLSLTTSTNVNLRMKSTSVSGTEWNFASIGTAAGREGNFEIQDNTRNRRPFMIAPQTGTSAPGYSLVISSSGSVGVGTIAPLTKLDVSGAIRIGYENNCGASYTGVIRYNGGALEYCNGSAWNALGVSGAGLTLLNGSASSTQSFAIGASGNSPAFVSANGVHTLDIPLASAAGSVTAGLLSNADYVAFGNKMSATSAAITAALGYMPANPVSVTTVENSLTSFTTSVAASFSAMTSSQWSTVASGIHYSSGNVGIGTTAPTTSLHIYSASATPLVVERSNAQNANILFKNTANSMFAGIAQSGSFGIGTTNNLDSSALLVVSGTSGNVGIGTTSPAAKWHVSNGNGALPSLGSTIYLMQNNANVTDNTVTTLISGVSGTGQISFGDAGAVNQGAIRYDHVTDSLGLYAGGFSNGERLTINATGNVGLGTTTPTARLQITQGTGSLAPLKFTSGTLLTSAQSGTMEYDGFNFYLTDGSNTRRSIALGSAAGSIDNASTINSTGNITMVPVGSVVVSSTTASTNSSTGSLVVRGGLGVAGNIYSSGTIVTSSNIQGASVTATSGVSTTVIQGVPYLALNPNGGNVGVGTTTPAFKLAVSGGLISNHSFFPSLYLVDNDAATSSTIGGVLRLQDENGNVAAAFGIPNSNNIVMMDARDSSGQIGFRTGGTNERMRIDSSGNVGIGTTSPIAKLDVSATTTATSGFNVGTNSYLYVMPSANQVVAVSNSNIANYGYTEIPVANTRNINSIYGTGGDAYNYSSNVTIQSMYGAYGMAYNNGTNVTINGEMAGGWAMAMNDKAATIEQMYGWWGGSRVTSGTVNHDTGVWGQVDAYGGTVSNMYGLRVNSVVSNAVVGNRYGIHIAMTGSTTNSSNDYAIYSRTGQKSFLSGSLGLGVSDVTARLQISSGTTSVAPLKFASGALLTSAQSGTMEYDGFNFYLTDGTNTRRSIATGSSAGTIDNASNVNSTGNITMTPTGSVVVSSTTASTNSTTGALVVRGGLGVAGNIYSSGTIITSSNMQAASFTATGTISSARMIVDGGSSVQLKMEPNAQAYGYQINTSGTVGTWAREFSFSHNDGKIGAMGMLANNGVPTYLYFSANAASATTVHAQPQMVLNSVGSLGLGVTSATRKLEISSTDGDGIPAFYVSENSVTSSQYVGQFHADNASFNSTVLRLSSDRVSSSAYNFIESIIDADGTSSTAFVVRGDGNVGIGTSAPSALLHVSKDQNASTSIYTTNFSSGTSASSNFIAFNDASNGYASFGVGGTSNTIYSSIIQDRAYITAGGNLQGILVGTEASTPIVFAPNTTERMRIDSSGNVGIGTSSPTTPLTVSGVVRSISGGFQFPDGSTQATAVGVGYGMAYSTSGSTVAVTTTWTDVSLSGGNVGLNGVSHNTGVNPSRMTVSTAGTYEISYSISFTQSATGATICSRVRVNGSTPVMGGTTCRSESPGSTFAGTMARTVMVTLAANDYVTLQAYANANSVFNLASAIAGVSDDAPSILTIKRLGN